MSRNITKLRNPAKNMQHGQIIHLGGSVLARKPLQMLRHLTINILLSEITTMLMRKLNQKTKKIDK